AARPDKVAHATERHGKLAKAKAELELFPVAGKHSLHDLASRYVKAGLLIGELISARGNQESTKGPSRGAAATLRTATLGLLNRLRRALHDELDETAAAPSDAARFAYLHQLETTRQNEHHTPT